MTDWTPMTQVNNISRLPYRYDQKTIIGFMGTHQPTVWMGDYGFLTLMPETGRRAVSPKERGLSILSGSEVAKPYYYSVMLGDTNQGIIHAEMTASMHCAFFQFAYSKTNNSQLLIEMSRLRDYNGWVKISDDHREAVGYNSDRHNVFRGRHMGPELKNFKGYYVIQFECPFDSFATWEELESENGAGSTNVQIHDGKNEMTGGQVGAFVHFPDRSETIKLRIGSSFISVDQARENLRREIPDWNFIRVADQNKNAWNECLCRVVIEGGTADEQTIFYTAMYHSLLFPRRFDEYGRYYSAFDEKIHEGISCNDYSMWDTFRALHPLLTLIDPQDVCRMIRSLLQMYGEGGWIPKWPIQLIATL